MCCKISRVPTASIEMVSSSRICFVNVGAVVARVQRTRMTEVAHGTAVKAVVKRWNRENKCDLLHTCTLRHHH